MPLLRQVDRDNRHRRVKAPDGQRSATFRAERLLHIFHLCHIFTLELVARGAFDLNIAVDDQRRLRERRNTPATTSNLSKESHQTTRNDRLLVI